MRLRFLGVGVFALTFLVVSACGSSSTDDGSNGEHGASGGDAGAMSGSGGKGGSSTGGAGGSGTGGSQTGGASGSANGGTSGSGVSGSGGSGGASGSSGSSGAGGDSKSCSRDDDCVVATTYSTAGCCSRGCGVALNAEWVENEPCATADPMTDPVPLSCSTGCLMCPQDPRCEVVYDAICLSGTCTAVTDYGPCSDDSDCVLAIDYESTLGACCSCSQVASRATLEHAPCIVSASDPKPQGCDPPADACATTSCPASCSVPMNLRCTSGHCVSG